MADAVIYHNPKCSTSRKTLEFLHEHPILIERPSVVTPKGTQLARPVDAAREIL